MRATTLDPRVERSRAAILATAANLLMEDGAGAVTIDAIVARSGVARTTIYRHWPSRKDVVFAAFEYLVEGEHGPPGVPPRAPVEARLRAFLTTIVNVIEHTGFGATFVSILEATARDPELAGLHERFMEKARAPFEEILNDAIRAGELPEGLDVSEATAQLAGPVLMRYLVTREPLDDAFVARIAELFMRSRRA